MPSIIVVELIVCTVCMGILIYNLWPQKRPTYTVLKIWNKQGVAIMYKNGYAINHVKLGARVGIQLEWDTKVVYID